MPDPEIGRTLDELTDEARRIREELRRRTHTLWVAIGVSAVFVSVVLVAGAGIILDNRRAIETNNRRWCPMVSLLLVRPGDPPPDTARGRRIGEQAEILFNQFGCTQSQEVAG